MENDRKNLKSQLSKIESQMTQLQLHIQYLMGKTVSTQESSNQSINENTSVDTETIESNEYEPSAKMKEHEKLMESIVHDNESKTHDREELLQSMAQNNESNPEWSMEASQSIYEAFSGDENNSIHLENVECGAMLCQASLYLDSITDFEDSYSEILNRSPWPGQGFASIDEESGRVEFYLAREGHELPNIEDGNTVDEY
jgi:hypothetical protein